MTDYELGWHEQADLYRADDRQVMDSETPKIGYEEPQTNPTGEQIWLRTSKAPLYNLEGEVCGVLGTYEDITASKQAEAEQRNLEVLCAADGIEALDVYREHREDISAILLDMTMPRMDGEETFRELRQLDPDVLVILASGYNEQDATTRFVGRGLAGFVQKPFTLHELQARVREALAPDTS